MKTIEAIIFDLGGVLIDWNPEYLYKKIFPDEIQRKYFLENICSPDWNEHQDAGRSLTEGTKTLIKKYPNYANEIKAYYDRWDEMLGGAFNGTVKILENIYGKNKYPLYALTNWSHETFPIALERFSFLQLFRSIIVSGIEKTRKPNKDFFQIILDRNHLIAKNTIFIDDNRRNIDAASEMGFATIHFTNASSLAKTLKSRYGIT